MQCLIFFEKPGCVGNQRQKQLLRRSGVDIDSRNLLTEPWRVERLRRYFGEAPVALWFNASAPDIKSGSIDIGACDAQQALQMMVANPLLIRRPLMALGELRQAGFEDGPVLLALGMRLRPGEDLTTCPMGDGAAICEALV